MRCSKSAFRNGGTQKESVMCRLRGRARPNLARLQVDVGRHRGRHRSNSAEFGPSSWDNVSTRLGQLGPQATRFGVCSSYCGPNSTKFDTLRLGIDQVWPESGPLRPTFARNRPNLAQFGQRPRLRRLRAIVARFRPNFGHLGRRNQKSFWRPCVDSPATPGPPPRLCSRRPKRIPSQLSRAADQSIRPNTGAQVSPAAVIRNAACAKHVLYSRAGDGIQHPPGRRIQATFGPLVPNSARIRPKAPQFQPSPGHIKR